MKKYFIVFLSMLFVAGLSVVAYADDGGIDSVRSGSEGVTVVIGGDAYVRGFWLNNWDMDNTEDTADDDKRYWDQRVRLKITAQLPGGVELRTRLTTGDDTWDNAQNTNSSLAVDYAYLHVPVGSLTLDLGRQKSDWGNKFLEWNATKDRAKLSTKFGDTAVGAYTDKMDENNGATGGKNSNDVDDYGLFVAHNAGDIAGGVLVVMHDDNLTADMDGVSGSGYVKVNVADLAIKAEVAVKADGVHKTTDKDGTVNNKNYGGFAEVSMGVGKANISGLVAFTQDGYVADNHFTPTVMIGTDNSTALADFGESPFGSTKQNSFLIKAGVEVEAMDDLSVNAQLAYLVLDSYGSAFADAADDAASALELDAGIKYQLAQNTTLNVDAGVMFPDNLTANDDHAVVVGQKIEIKF